MNLKSQRKTKLNARKVTSETPMTKIRQAVSHTFHLPHVRDKETKSEARREREKLKPLIRWLKNTTGFHLQASSTNRENHSLTHDGQNKDLEQQK
jgi:hypothetical protein